MWSSQDPQGIIAGWSDDEIDNGWESDEAAVDLAGKRRRIRCALGV